jgi:hypothetical protein
MTVYEHSSQYSQDQDGVGVPRVRSQAIERLRQGSDAGNGHRDPQSSAEQVGAIVTGIRRCASPWQIAGSAQVEVDEVLSTVASFGTWLGYSRGRARTPVVEAAATGELFPSNDRLDRIVIPDGFEPGALGRRNLTRSVAVIAEADPDEALIRRWLDRTASSERTSTLTYEVVIALWQVARLGRLEEVEGISPSPAFRRTLVAGFDLLASAIDEANVRLVALRQIARSEAVEILAARDEVEEHAAALAWLHPQPMRQLKELVEHARVGELGPRALVARVRHLGPEASGQLVTQPLSGIASLNEAQVKRACERAGLSTDPVEFHDEQRIRRRIEELGLDRDLDQLLPEGLRALRSDRLEVFFEAIEARAAGDADWALRLLPSAGPGEPRADR